MVRVVCDDTSPLLDVAHCGVAFLLPRTNGELAAPTPSASFDGGVSQLVLHVENGIIETFLLMCGTFLGSGLNYYRQQQNNIYTPTAEARQDRARVLAGVQGIAGRASGRATLDQLITSDESELCRSDSSTRVSDESAMPGRDSSERRVAAARRVGVTRPTSGTSTVGQVSRTSVVGRWTLLSLDVYHPKPVHQTQQRRRRLWAAASVLGRDPAS